MSSQAKVGTKVEATPRKVASISAVRSPRLQRKCACGGSGGECESCKKKPKEMLQRKAMPGAPALAPASAPAASKTAPPAASPTPAANKTTTPAAAKASPQPTGAAAALAAKVPPPKPKAPVESSVAAIPGSAKPKTEPGAKPATPSPVPPSGAAAPKIVAPPVAQPAGTIPGVAKPQGTVPGKEVPTKEKGAAAAKPVEPSRLPPTVQRVLQTPGLPLEPAVRSTMEARFGRSFRDVRIHTDAQAAQSAREVHARAYTVGQHVVFDSGQYQPGTPEGKQLLAHELAHTVQQQGLQRFSDDLLSSDGSNEYQHLEREAESISRAVMSAPAPRSVPVSTNSASQPTLSRAGADTSTSQLISCDKDESERKWISITTEKNMRGAKVKRYSLPGVDVQSDKNNDSGKPTEKNIVAIDMDEPFILPADKGNVLEVWKKRMSGCNLEAIIDPGEGSVKTKAGLKQARPDPGPLRKIWLQKVNWTSNVEKNWLEAVKRTEAGKKDPASTAKNTSFEPTKAAGSTCNTDHILELQIGGNNVPENLQMLDDVENQRSGREIFQDLANKAERIRAAMKVDLPQVEVKSVLMRFSSISAPTQPTCGPCCQADAEAPKVTGEGVGPAAAPGTEYPFLAGGFDTKVVADEKEKDVKLAESEIGRNKSASTLIPGLSLVSWSRKTPKEGGTVHAALDPKAGSRKRDTALPESLKGEKPFDLHRSPTDGKLTLAATRPNIKFHYDYLSDGVFTTLKLEDDGTLSGSGTITPSFKFLPKFDVTFDKEKFVLSKDIPKEKLKLPIPGLKVTEAKIGLQLGPDFKPEGIVAFQLDAGQKKLLDGSITLSADAGGLVAEGKVHAFLPGVDNAEGSLKLQNKHWTGEVKIETTQLQSKLKYIKSGGVVVKFSDDGMSAEGTVNLDIPLTKGVEAKLSYDSSKKRWAFKGKGAFQIPRLKEAELEIEYDGEHLSGGTGPAGVGFEFHGLTGTVHVRYKDEKFSGSGKLAINKGKAQGSLEVTMHPGKESPTFSGKGEISYQISPNLIAKAGIEIDEHEKVRLTGALEFPQPIPLFKPLEGNYKFFEVGVSIPIPGASIGPIGLKARIDGSLSAGYKLGPGELRNTKIEAAFNPLDEKPDADVLLTSTLFIGASAYIKGSISGSIVVDVGIASVSGGLTISATASVEGHIASQATIHYSKSKLEFDANFEMLVGLALILALEAFVKAQAGIGPFKVETEKRWTLASYKYDTGLQFGMKLKNPLHYASDQPLKLPTFDDIEWVVPKDISAGDVLSKVFGGSSSKEQETS